MPTTDELAAQLAALTAEVDKLRVTDLRREEPTIVENWGVRTCAVCGIEAVMIDTSRATRATSRNGEGYCEDHGTERNVEDGAHIRRGVRPR